MRKNPVILNEVKNLLTAFVSFNQVRHSSESMDLMTQSVLLKL